jgi:flagellar protein FliO/FliZ
MELFLRVVLSLGAVVGLMWFLARIASKRVGGTNGSLVKLMGRQSLGRTASVAVLSIGERVLVVGVTENGVRLLTELDADEVDVPVEANLRAADVHSTEATEVSAVKSLAPAGSLLSGQTWKQAWQSATTRSGAST